MWQTISSWSLLVLIAWGVAYTSTLTVKDAQTSCVVLGCLYLAVSVFEKQQETKALLLMMSVVAMIQLATLNLHSAWLLVFVLPVAVRILYEVTERCTAGYQNQTDANDDTLYFLIVSLAALVPSFLPIAWYSVILSALIFWFVCMIKRSNERCKLPDPAVGIVEIP